MKFTKGLLTLFVISSSFAFNIPISKRDEIDDALAQYDKMTNSNGQINSSNSQTNVNNFNQGQINSNTNNINQGQVNSNTNNINQGQVNSNINNNVNSQNTNGNINNINISNECQNVINEYRSCFQSLRKDNYDKVCDLYNSDLCQNLIKKKINENEPCKNMNDSTGFQNMVDISIIGMNLSCGKIDKDGDYCPIAKYGKSTKDAELTDAIINETCKYKVCRDKAIEFFTQYKIINEELSKKSNFVKRKTIDMERIDSAILLLNNNQCAAQANSANSLNIKNPLLFSFGLFLLLFL